MFFVLFLVFLPNLGKNDENLMKIWKYCVFSPDLAGFGANPGVILFIFMGVGCRELKIPVYAIYVEILKELPCFRYLT